MKLSSPVFQQEGVIPLKYTCQGEDINPPLLIEGVPQGAKSLALIVEDPDAPSGLFIHWILFDIPSNTREIKANSIPGKRGLNDFQRKDFGGPCPPSGTHRYFFKLYALDTLLNVKEGVSREVLLDAMTGHIIATSELIGYYRKK